MSSVVSKAPRPGWKRNSKLRQRKRSGRRASVAEEGAGTGFFDSRTLHVGRVSLGIRRHGLQVRLHDLPDAGFCCVARDFGGAGLTQPQRFSQALDGEVEAGALLVALARSPAVAKQIDDGFGRIVDSNGEAFDRMPLDACFQHLRSASSLGLLTLRARHRSLESRA